MNSKARQGSGGGGSGAASVYAVSPSVRLCATRLRDNACTWGDAAHCSVAITSASIAAPGAAAAPTASHGGAYPPPPSTAVAASAATAAATNPSLPSSATSQFTWAALSFGERHGAGITISGQLLAWGMNNRGQAGWGEDRAHSSRKIGGASADASTAATVSTTGSGAGAGAGASIGPAGLQGAAEPGVPRPVFLAPSVTVQAVACGGEHTLALTSVGVLAWGCNRLVSAWGVD